MKRSSIFKLFISAAISSAVSIGSAQAVEVMTDEVSGSADELTYDRVNRPGRPGRPERPERPDRPNRPGRPDRPNRPGNGYVSKVIQIRADKLGGVDQAISVRENANYLRLTALKNHIAFRDVFEVIGDSRYPLIYRLRDLREGESIILDLRNGYYPMYIDYLRLHIESPNLIGSRAVLQVEFIQ